MWEQKCDCQKSLHDYQGRYRWSADGTFETVWDWIAKVNGESRGGFAGYDDWRIPNVKELLSLVDFERHDPAVAIELDTCEQACDEPGGAGCACTMKAAYWTSTTFADFPAHALQVDFVNGSLDDRLKTRRSHVRAVRGPVADAAEGDASSSRGVRVAAACAPRSFAARWFASAPRWRRACSLRGRTPRR